MYNNIFLRASHGFSCCLIGACHAAVSGISLPFICAATGGKDGNWTSSSLCRDATDAAEAAAASEAEAAAAAAAAEAAAAAAEAEAATAAEAAAAAAEAEAA
jgi:hypothetical protein